jgi:hypothetical protein
MNAKRLFYVVGLLVGSLVVFYVAAPAISLAYVRKNLGPDFQVEALSVGQKGLTLRGVSVTKPWVQGRAESVFCSWDKHVVAEGGSFVVDPGARKAGSGTTASGYQVTARAMTVTVRKDGAEVRFQGVAYEEGRVSFEGAKVLYPPLTEHGYQTVLFGEGWARTDGTEVVLTTALAIGPGVPMVSSADVRVLPKERKATVGQLSIENRPPSPKVPYPFAALAEEATVTEEGGQLVAVAKRATVESPALSSESLTSHDLRVTFDPAGKLWVERASVRLAVDAKAKTVEAAGSCQDWLGLLPDELKAPAPFASLQLSGDIRAKVDAGEKPKLSLDMTCKAACAPLGFAQTLRKRFTYVAYDKGGQPFERTTGPATAEWVPLGDVSPTMAMALTNTEDPGFFVHRGFIRQAYENSLIENVKAGKVVRGGSTLTMQLAKNLWLRRERTLGRKAQEAFLTFALESCLTKEQILETYLNVVEFGPNIYGIGPAAKKLLSEAPSQITLVEALYLTTRLPNPTKGGSLDDTRRAQLAKMVARLVKEGRVPEDMAAIEGGDETPVALPPGLD